MELLRPYYLLLLPMVALVWWQLKRRCPKQSLQQLIAPHLSKQLVTGDTASQQGVNIIATLLVIAVIALSGPSFRSHEVPIKQISPARVIVMDMSANMLATDLKPNRLTQARFKALDLVKQRTEGEQALIAYAGDAFTISPLTSDAGNLLNLIPNLAPNIMPAMGNNPLSGLDLGIELLTNSGYQHGDIIFISGGFSASQVEQMQSRLKGQPWRISVLATGTAKGAPISLANGDLLKDEQGNIVVAQLDAPAMQQLARASGGIYVPLSASKRDIELLNNIELLDAQISRTDGLEQQQTNQAVDDGYWLMFLILPFFLLAFRRGQLASFILVGMLTIPQPSQASWWQNSQKQAYDAFEQQNYEQAAQQFDAPLWQGSALYKAQDYQGAAEAFKQVKTAEGFYNLGNALAMQQEFEGAIAAYDQALKLAPNLKSAKDNKAKIEELLKQQQQQNQNQDQQQDNQQSDQQNKQQQNKEQQDKEQEQQSQGQQSQDDKSQQESQEQQSSEQSQQNQSEQNSEAQNTQNQAAKNAESQRDQQQDDNAQQQDQSQQNDQAQTEPSPVPSSQQGSVASPEPSDEQQSAQQAISQAIEGDAEPEEEGPEMPYLLQQMPDDPAILLRNKMRLEYQKRQRENR
ncbi:VWA domain-containing protein [Motilimonas sp. E26]|uniref:vWA domain-containing protein n=1 Tax=Motilimonas sp. E26 TaxID=2865674 RepID=UPI001E536D75|nr:VWA domain-containing protein [Motilimonas sp. E26]MCE0558299.1 VWA domain-containing protein [Motilimonas sp. E26]